MPQPRTPLLNRSQVRRYVMEVAKTRAHRFTRVSGEFLLTCEAHLKEFIRGHLHRHPSKGRTIR